MFARWCLAGKCECEVLFTSSGKFSVDKCCTIYIVLNAIELCYYSIIEPTHYLESLKKFMVEKDF